MKIIPHLSLDLTECEFDVFSRDGADGILEVLISVLYYNRKYQNYYVEIGVGDGTECNTRNLRERYDWCGLMLDGGWSNPEINLHQYFLTKDNVVDLMEGHKVPKQFELLSIDIDYNDFYLLYEIIKNYTMDIVVCEYNSHIPPNEDKVVIYDDGGWDQTTDYYGASIYSMYKLMMCYGYTLIYADNAGANLFFLHNKIVKNGSVSFKDMNDVPKIHKPPNFFQQGVRHVADHMKREYTSSLKIMGDR